MKPIRSIEIAVLALVLLVPLLGSKLTRPASSRSDTQPISASAPMPARC
jgi:hypothetical protein